MYIDELIANSTPIPDIEPYSPVNSICSHNLSDDEIAILSNSPSINNDNHITSDDMINSDVDKDTWRVLDLLLLEIEQMVINETENRKQ